jgi:hypothetical protein
VTVINIFTFHDVECPAYLRAYVRELSSDMIIKLAGHVVSRIFFFSPVFNLLPFALSVSKEGINDDYKAFICLLGNNDKAAHLE